MNVKFALLSQLHTPPIIRTQVDINIIFLSFHYTSYSQEGNGKQQ